MKERLLLFIIVLGLTVLVYIFQSYTVWGLGILISLMTLYAIFTNIAYKIKKRQQLKTPPVRNENYKPFVSIMIPAHNEESVIATTVETVLKLDYPNFEIIAIDDRSTDNTASVLKDLEQKYPNKVIAFIRPKDAFPGKSAVLNDALEFAKGEAILVFDADATMEPDFLTNLVYELEPKDVGAVQARKIVRNKDVNLLTKCQNNEMTMDTHFQVGRDSVKGAVELRGNGELIKREALEDIGGWNNYTITDDLDMSTRLHIKGWDVRFCANTAVYEEGIMYLVPLYKQRRRWIEGSIRRYLEAFWDILTSKKMSMRARLDMIAYISEFIMPAWFIIEIAIRIFKILIKDASPHILMTSMIMACIIGFGFVMACRYSLRRYDNVPRTDALIQAIYTAVYLLVIWMPLVLFIGTKILFMKKDMNWGKTAHGLVQHEHAIIRAKEKIRKAKEELRKLLSK
ncbi:glycosyltransferase family 2 protein [bacterium]|nr:glycosyltransferase family 2 protein [bacterium]MBO5447494.1 glycosyltransferase family 2 protein [bacterium]